jgi:hypothetical protein
MNIRSIAALGLAAAAIAAQGAETARLRGTVRDAATGLPASCTVTITDSAGQNVIERKSYASGFRCDGRFEKLLPAGPTRIRIVRGFETRAVDREIELAAGSVTEMDFELHRVVDLRRRGWYGGDSHVHMVHGEKPIPVDFDFVARTAQAEDLQYLSLSHDWQMAHPTPEGLDAELARRSTPACALTWNLEAPKNYYLGDAGRCLGHCWSIGTRGRTPSGQDVIALLLEASAMDYESAKPTYANFESHHLIHAQGGTVFYTHPARWWTGPWGGQGGYPHRDKMRVSNLAVELPLDTLSGPTYDGLDLITGGGELGANARAFELWALLLNHGYRLAGTGSSDACFDRVGGGVPGVARTYSFVEGQFSVPAAARATGAGRTFVTTGPLLVVTVNGQPPGTAFAPHPAGHKLAIEAWASGQDSGGLGRVEILRNGAAWAQAVLDPHPAVWQTNVLIRESEAAWYCVRAFGSDPKKQRAISGAFYFDPQPHSPPKPVKARVHARVVDAQTGRPIAATLSELTFQGPVPQVGKGHTLETGERTLEVPADVRLQAAAPGYAPETRSPFLDHPALVEKITQLEEQDLVDWTTFERIRELLQDVRLTFALKRN